MKKPKSKSRNGAGAFTAYTDRDRVKKLTTETAILAEYRRLKWPPVVCAGVLLSPALVELLKEHEPELMAKTTTAAGLSDTPAPEPAP